MILELVKLAAAESIALAIMSSSMSIDSELVGSAVIEEGEQDSMMVKTTRLSLGQPVVRYDMANGYLARSVRVLVILMDESTKFIHNRNTRDTLHVTTSQFSQKLPTRIVKAGSPRLSP